MGRVSLFSFVRLACKADGIAGRFKLMFLTVLTIWGLTALEVLFSAERLTYNQGPCKLHVELTAEKAAGEHSVQASKPPTQSVGGVCKVNLQAREDKVKAVKWYVPMHIELCPREHKKSMEDLIEIKKD